jgi:hypothetical protein
VNDERLAATCSGAEEPLGELERKWMRLEELKDQLEEAKKLNPEAVVADQAELEELRRSFVEWARKQVKEEDGQDFSEADYTITAEEVLAELEKQQNS